MPEKKISTVDEEEEELKTFEWVKSQGTLDDKSSIIMCMSNDVDTAMRGFGNSMETCMYESALMFVERAGDVIALMAELLETMKNTSIKERFKVGAQGDDVIT